MARQIKGKSNEIKQYKVNERYHELQNKQE